MGDFAPVYRLCVAGMRESLHGAFLFGSVCSIRYSRTSEWGKGAGAVALNG